MSVPIHLQLQHSILSLTSLQLPSPDAAGNACPSLHVATAVFSAIWIERLLRDVRAPWPLRCFNWAWVLLIVHSTLAIKQHVVLDAVAGVALALLMALPSLRWFPHTPRASRD